MRKRLRRERACLVLLRCRHTINHHLSVSNESRPVLSAKIHFSSFLIYSVPFRITSPQFLSSSSQSARIKSSPIQSISPPLHFSAPSVAIPFPRDAFPCHAMSCPFCAIPLRLASPQSFSESCRILASPFRHVSYPLDSSPLRF